MKENTFWIFLFNHWSKTQTQAQQSEHSAPRVKENSEDKNDEERDAWIEELDAVKAEYMAKI